MLQFDNVTIQKAVEALRQHVPHRDRAKAHNYVFEETVSAERKTKFEAHLGDVENVRELLDGHVNYVRENIEIDGETPDTFRVDLRPSEAGDLDEAQDLVRVESLSGPLEAFFGFKNSHGSAELLRHFEKLKGAWESRTPEGNALIEKFLATWNAKRDERPAFSTFLDGLRDDAVHPDWQHLLRDRLGLAHYEPGPGTAIPVVLMVYSVKDVIVAAPKNVVPITCPTVMDSKPWEYYFPAPKVMPYGRAMALRTDGGEESLQPEILHTRIKYKRHHIKAMALIDRPWGPKELSDLRNHHLWKVRLALLAEPAVDETHEFGEEIL